MKYLLLLCDVRAGAVHNPTTAALKAPGRIYAALRHARASNWAIAHLIKGRGGRPLQTLPGYEPLPSEAVFFAEDDTAFDPRALLETAIAADASLAAAGFSFRALIAPILLACANARVPSLLLEDAVDLGPDEEFSLRSVLRRGVQLAPVESIVRRGATNVK